MRGAGAYQEVAPKSHKKRKKNQNGGLRNEGVSPRTDTDESLEIYGRVRQKCDWCGPSPTVSGTMVVASVAMETSRTPPRLQLQQGLVGGLMSYHMPMPVPVPMPGEGDLPPDSGGAAAAAGAVEGSATGVSGAAGGGGFVDAVGGPPGVSVKWGRGARPGRRSVGRFLDISAAGPFWRTGRARDTMGRRRGVCGTGRRGFSRGHWGHCRNSVGMGIRGWRIRCWIN
jgi:hypothetical protein